VQTLNLLLSSDIGRDFILQEDRWMGSIADMIRLETELAQAPEDPRFKDQRLLTPEKALKTMSRGLLWIKIFFFFPFLIVNLLTHFFFVQNILRYWEL
jgi:hypothetical protein